VLELDHWLDHAVRCVACGKTARRRTPVRSVRAGWIHARCAAGFDDANAQHLEVVSRAPRGFAKPNPRNDPQYRKRRAQLFDQARRFDAWGCHWCGRETSETLHRDHPLRAVADHVIAVARDPEHSTLVVACRECNRDRSDKPGPPPWLHGWTPGTPLPMSPTERRLIRAREPKRPRRRPPWTRFDG
jgi:hypothetical protein